MDLVPQHLVTAAQAKHQPAAPDMGLDIDIPAIMAECRQIGDGRFRAGHDDEAGIRRDGFSWLDEDYRNARFQPQRVQIVEIGDARQA